ncbi:hypothetical protein JD79_02602 [Geodermatophilus normandii]|uniref:Uncharacterized protein n=1 Tax=Geodermatophilus normandii TaxID=1137989 RepID=A0A317QID7_9ACTN|nr:hypothetical protein [Geodermatophilus normandii]PWW23428.1 hypothetical protein JD79_02602 [Geodermatophilus normandii]
MANATTAAPAPLRTERETARRAWPLRAALGVLLVVLAVVAVVTGDLGARLLLGGLGLLAAARGSGLLRSGSVPPGAAAVAGGWPRSPWRSRRPPPPAGSCWPGCR